jgi:hypothetical protein
VETSTKNLLFLLAAAPMGLTGCLGDGDDGSVTTLLTSFTTFDDGPDDETESNSGDGDGDSGDGDGDSGDGDGDSGDGDGDGDSGDGDGDTGDGDGDTGDGDGDGDSGDGDGDTGDGDGDTGDGDGDGDGVCSDYAALLEQCYGPGTYEEDCLAALEYYAMQPGCVELLEAFYVCFSQLDCAEVEMGQSCLLEAQAFVNSCG